MNKKLHILLTGASGTVGLEILRKLIQFRNSYEITAFDLKTKSSVKKLNPFKNDIQIVYGDIANFNVVQKVCKNKDFVIHLAAIIPPRADDLPELAYKVNTIGTRNLVNGLEQLSPKAFLIFSSSVSVYGDRLKNPFIKVGDPLVASEGDEYAKTKIKAEQIICESKLDWSIFRLTAVMGNHKPTKLLFHMPLATSLEIAGREDTAAAFVSALDKKAMLSKKIFNLGGGINCRASYKDFLARSFRVLGLGNLDFPHKAFAEKNFHCGFYEDGNILNEILHFQKETLEGYFKKTIQSTPLWQRIVFSLLRIPIKKFLLRKSEPYHAFKTGNQIMLKRFFY